MYMMLQSKDATLVPDITDTEYRHVKMVTGKSVSNR